MELSTERPKRARTEVVSLVITRLICRRTPAPHRVARGRTRLRSLASCVLRKALRTGASCVAGRSLLVGSDRSARFGFSESSVSGAESEYGATCIHSRGWWSQCGVRGQRGTIKLIESSVIRTIPIPHRARGDARRPIVLHSSAYLCGCAHALTWPRAASPLACSASPPPCSASSTCPPRSWSLPPPSCPRPP